MKRAVFYGRYSSDRQTEQSIEGQRRVCEEFAKAEQIQIVGEYIDWEPPALLQSIESSSRKC